MISSMKPQWALIVLMLGVAACSGIKTYPNDAPKNLHARVQTEGAKASLHIHEVTGRCATRYVGSLALDRPSIDVGLPAGRPALLIVAFDTSSFLGGARSTTVETMLEPRAGYDYDLSVRYKDAIYDVALREVDRRRGVSRELARQPLAGC